MKATDVGFFEKVQAQILQLHGEISLLSKSKPNNPINKFKLTFINEKLGEANRILTGSFKPFEAFHQFEEENPPTNSDVVMILSQYLECLEAWRSANARYSAAEGWFWNTEDDEKIKGKAPTRYRRESA